MSRKIFFSIPVSYYQTRMGKYNTLDLSLLSSTLLLLLGRKGECESVPLSGSPVQKCLPGCFNNHLQYVMLYLVLFVVLYNVCGYNR